MQSISIVPAIATAVFLGAVSLPVSAPQDPAKPRSTDFVIEAGDHNIKALIDRAATYLGRNYIYSEGDLQNIPDTSIKLQNRLVLDATGCEEVVGELAYSKGLAMMPVDETRGIYEWIYRMGPKRAELSAAAIEMTPEKVLAQRKRRIVVRTTIALEEMNANSMTNQLRPFFVQGGGQSALTIGAAGNSLLLEGFSHQVATAIEMIEKVQGSLEDLDPGLLTWKARVDERLDRIEKRIDKLSKGSK